MADRILVVGEALVDVVHRADGSVAEHAGGSPANVAIGLARLGHPVEFAAHFGTDRLGEMVREHLTADELVTLVPGAQQGEHTSTAQATIGADGSASYEFDLHWDVADLLTDTDDVGHFHTGSIAATLEPGASAVVDAARRARETGTVSYDPNARPSIMRDAADVRARVEELVGLSDVVKASDEDLAWLYPDAAVGEIVPLWGRLGPSLVIVTRGGEGCSVYLPTSGEYAERAGYAVDVVDTVGAGDSFMAGLLSALLDDGLLGSAAARESLRSARLEDVERAVRRAIACGAVTVSRAGANPPTRADLSAGS